MKGRSIFGLVVSLAVLGAGSLPVLAQEQYQRSKLTANEVYLDNNCRRDQELLQEDRFILFYRSQFRANNQDYWFYAGRYQDGAAIFCISKPNFNEAKPLDRNLKIQFQFIDNIVKVSNVNNTFIVTVREGNGSGIPLTDYKLDLSNPNRPLLTVSDARTTVSRTPSSQQQSATGRSANSNSGQQGRSSNPQAPQSTNNTDPVAPLSIKPGSTNENCFFAGFCARPSQKSAHSGIDYMVSGGTEVIAICDGKVIEARTKSTTPNIWNRFTIVEHNNCGGYPKIYAYYGHLSASVSLNQVVKKGQIIGTIDEDWPSNQGGKLNSHLHFGLATIYYPNGWGYPDIGIITQSISGGDSRRREELIKKGWIDPKTFESRFNWWIRS